MNSRQGAKYAK